MYALLVNLHITLVEVPCMLAVLHSIGDSSREDYPNATGNGEQRRHSLNTMLVAQLISPDKQVHLHPCTHLMHILVET